MIDGDLGKKLDESTSFINFVNSRRLEYLKKLGKWRHVNSLAKQMLNKEPDQWNLHQDYITSVFHTVDGDIQEDDNIDDVVDKSIDDAASFISGLKEANPKCRGPLLAHIELESRRVARRDPLASDGKKN